MLLDSFPRAHCNPRMLPFTFIYVHISHLLYINVCHSVFCLVYYSHACTIQGYNCIVISLQLLHSKNTGLEARKKHWFVQMSTSYNLCEKIRCGTKAGLEDTTKILIPISILSRRVFQTGCLFASTWIMSLGENNKILLEWFTLLLAKLNTIRKTKDTA